MLIFDVCSCTNSEKRKRETNSNVRSTTLMENNVNYAEGNSLSTKSYRKKRWKMPKDWKKHLLMSGRCSIYLPSNLKETMYYGGSYTSPENGTGFENNDSVTDKHYYCIVGIAYYYGHPGSFYKHGDCKFIEESSFKKDMQIIVDDIIGYECIDLLEEGPFCNVEFNESYDDGNRIGHDVYFEVYYKRKSIFQGEDPMVVHMYIFQDDTNKVEITMSHHEKDSLVFKDLFQAVQTFRWHHK